MCQPQEPEPLWHHTSENQTESEQIISFHNIHSFHHDLLSVLDIDTLAGLVGQPLALEVENEV